MALRHRDKPWNWVEACWPTRSRDHKRYARRQARRRDKEQLRLGTLDDFYDRNPHRYTKNLQGWEP